MKITNFVTLKKAGKLSELADAIKTACARVEQDFGIAIKIGGIRYADSYADIKLTCSVIGENGRVATKDSQAYTECAHLFGLKPEDLYKKFTSDGTEYEITGLRTGGGKMPVIVKRTKDGKSFRMTSDAVKKGLGIPSPKSSTLTEC